GYVAASTTVLLEADLEAPEVRDPKAAVVRRIARFEVTDDAMPGNWWEALAIGNFRPTRFQLIAKADGQELASATTWDMNAFGRGDGRSRIGVFAMTVAPEQRRKGYGRHLICEILRKARSERVAVAALQTRSTNPAALWLYQGLGFAPVGISTLYRKA